MRSTFERCSVDTSSRDIVLDGEAMELSPKAFELLKVLIDARPRVVTKAEVMQARRRPKTWASTWVAFITTSCPSVRAGPGPGGTGPDVPVGVHVEAGFWDAYTIASATTKSMQQQVFTLLDGYAASDQPIELWITGHSLGAALSTLFTLDVALDPDFVVHCHAAANYQAVLQCAKSSPGGVCVNADLSVPGDGYTLTSKAAEPGSVKD